MKTIATLSEYEKLYADYVMYNRLKGATNFFIDTGAIFRYIAEGKVKYEIDGGVLFIFVDEGEFYRLYFCGLTNDTRRTPTADKDVCCDVYEQKKNDTHMEFVHNLLLSSGFICLQEYEQVRFCLGHLHKLSFGYLEKCRKMLSDANMTIGAVAIDERETVEKMIAEMFDRYDRLSIEDGDWEEQVKNGNVVGIYCNEKLIAAYYFAPKGGRIMVSGKYRGKNLSILLRMYFASQKRWEDSAANQHGWMRVGNFSSQKSLDLLFKEAREHPVYTGKVKLRYVFQPAREP